MPRGDTSDPGPGQRSGSRRKTVLGSSDFAFVEPFVEGVASINYDLLNDMLSSMTEYQCSLMFVMLGENFVLPGSTYTPPQKGLQD